MPTLSTPLLKSDYHYDLPDELIAVEPAQKREWSRMMVLNRSGRGLSHRYFYQFPDLLEPGSILVLNNSRVLPARLPGQRETGAALDLLLVTDLGENRWQCKIKNLGRMKTGERFSLCDRRLRATLLEKDADGFCIVQFQVDKDFLSLLEQVGYAPLPPYIQKMRRAEWDRSLDLRRYQTVYAEHYGSIAAPTAGFHFTPEILKSLEPLDITIAYITLHVGVGTFEPIREEDASRHDMHEEHFEISEKTAGIIEEGKAKRKKIVAVGTTTTRALESAWQENSLKTGPQSTRLFIYPPYRYRVIDQLLTNFHLPESTLLMLVAAFCDREFLLDAYREAVSQRYRFFSYGDCMFIL